MCFANTSNYKLVPEWRDPFIFDIFCEIGSFTM